MQVRPEQLAGHLERGLQCVYVISGDEPLLVQECVDRIRQAAAAAGISERERHTVDRGFSWDNLLADSQALSLFADRKLMELRFTGKPDSAATAALKMLGERPPEDTTLLVILPRLDKSGLDSAWMQQLHAQGCLVVIYDISAAELPAWLRSRAREAGLQLADDALQLLVDRTEGNLLAAGQTLEKLRLLHGGGLIEADAVADMVSDSARYSVFDLADAVLIGDAERAARLLLGLQAEGQAESVVLWALQKDVRALILAAEQMARDGQRQASPQLLGKLGFWSKRQGPAQQALRRLSLVRLQRIGSGLVDVDKAIKGQSPERAWDALLRLVMALSGRPLFAARSAG